MAKPWIYSGDIFHSCWWAIQVAISEVLPEVEREFDDPSQENLEIINPTDWRVQQIFPSSRNISKIVPNQTEYACTLCIYIYISRNSTWWNYRYYPDPPNHPMILRIFSRTTPEGCSANLAPIVILDLRLAMMLRNKYTWSSFYLMGRLMFIGFFEGNDWNIDLQLGFAA